MAGEKPWVLIVDDEEELLEILASKVSAGGFRVLTASKVSQAVKMIANQQFSCLVLDLRLEGGTGESIIATIRRDKTNLNYSTPILVISGHLNQDVVQKIAGEISGALVKPFEGAELVERLKMLCC